MIHIANGSTYSPSSSVAGVIAIASSIASPTVKLEITEASASSLTFNCVESMIENIGLDLESALDGFFTVVVSNSTITIEAA